MSKVSVDDRLVKLKKNDVEILQRLSRLEDYCQRLIGVPLARGRHETEDKIKSLYEKISAVSAARGMALTNADLLFRFIADNKLDDIFGLVLKEKDETEKELLTKNFNLFQDISAGFHLAARHRVITPYPKHIAKCGKEH